MDLLLNLIIGGVALFLLKRAMVGPQCMLARGALLLMVVGVALVVIAEKGSVLFHLGGVAVALGLLFALVLLLTTMWHDFKASHQ